jgi:septal ring factor EnvC (AmiA/AmiB activator)
MYGIEILFHDFHSFIPIMYCNVAMTVKSLNVHTQHWHYDRRMSCGFQNEKEQLATELVEEREKLETAKRQEDSVQEALNNSVAIFNQRQKDMQKDIDRLRGELAEEQRRLDTYIKIYLKKKKMTCAH